MQVVFVIRDLTTLFTVDEQLADDPLRPAALADLVGRAAEIPLAGVAECGARREIEGARHTVGACANALSV